jgi:very-short-patch-repair endonuclease
VNSKIRSPQYVIKLARSMRLNLTPSERILWEELRAKKMSGYKFRIQHPIFRYILDFYCHNKMLAIEIDGDIHKLRQDYDEYRDEFLKNIGITTLRFKNEDVVNNLEKVLVEIKNKLIS